MSLLIPTNLTDSGKKSPNPNHVRPPETKMPPPGPTASAPPVIRMPIDTDPIMERDEYGAEMGREARVWKIYVKETDRADGELVEGWNKSLDVILVFAALFSAISTAFLIESSQKLQEDPADVTAQTLLAISRVLSVLVNTTQPTSVEPLPSIDAGPFSPPRIMVAVNALWYLSLSLSVATSLLAMLAKDWCHSFLAGRTGHSYTQTMRRQQKWMMIEKWKMQELIMVLPSLIHLALLLFAIGLCIYVWEMNNGVAWPVICVTGASAGFYLWCSITASIIEYFPYTTVVSRFLRSDWGIHISGRLHKAFKLLCIVAARRVSRTLETVYQTFDLRIRKWYESLDQWANELEAPLPVHVPETSPQDKVITLALRWLVTVCEAPYAIDAALQAIAGANSHIDRGPLEECKASLEISKRLVTGSIHKSSDKHVISLYVRALSFLGSKGTKNAPQTDGLGDIQVAVWTLQAQYDDQVAQLIGDGAFIPTDQNIDALGISSGIASHIMQVMNGLEQDSTSLSKSISQLLKNHHQNDTLHPATLKSLINASQLLSICTMDSKALVQLLDWLLVIAANPLDQHLSSKQMALYCANLLAQNLCRCLTPTTPNPHSAPLAFARDMIHHITTKVSVELSFSELVPKIASQILELITRPDLYPVPAPSDGLQNTTYQKGQLNIKELLDSLANTQMLGRYFHNAFQNHFNQVLEAYKLTKDPTHISSTYLLLVEVLLCNGLQTRAFHSYPLFHSPFPKLCWELVETLETHDIIPLLEQTSTSASEQLQIHAISLLWLLCALESYASPDFDVIRSRLSTQLHRCTTWGDAAVMKRALGYQLRHHWVTLNRAESRNNLNGYQKYLSRVFECVVEAGDHITPSTAAEEVTGEGLMGLKDQLNEHVQYVPEEYRGLASFTAYGRQNPVEQSSSQPHLVLEIIDGRQSETH
ncbi:hypothetical protein ACGC1H_004400 [Rhizoctonia solani]